MEKLKKQIKDLILNKKYGIHDKIIAIYNIVDDKNDIGPLAKALGLDEFILSDWELTEIPADLKPTRSLLSQFIDLFQEYHKKIHGRGFDFDKKEIGQINNCIKKFKDLDTWRHLLILTEKAYIKEQAGETIRGTWIFIISNLKPSTIFNQRNFILNEESRVNKILSPKKKKEWNW